MDEVWADLGAHLSDDETVDPDDVTRAVERSTDRVVLVDGPAELLAVLSRPFELWRVYLHPTQQKVVDVLDRIDTLTVDTVARAIYVAAHGWFTVMPDPEQKQLWTSVITGLGTPFTETFLAEEWRQVILAQEITTAEQYRTATRTGRGKPLGPRQRDQVWAAVEAFTTRLATSGKDTWESLVVEATRLLRDGATSPYRHVVIDEAQDLSLIQWRFLRALVPTQPDDLFLAGDAHQRIYPHRVTLNRVGIPTTGRSARLTINYRTTAEILAWSLGMLRGETIDDLDDGLDRIAGYRSPLHGRHPTLTGYRNRAAELAGLAEAVQAWLDHGIRPEEIGIAVRSNALAEAIARALADADIPVRLLAEPDQPEPDQPETAVAVATMHRMKGLEFRCMAVAALNDRTMPMAVTPEADDPLTHAHDLQRERCLLFVACTRAREDLRVSWYGTPSRFLDNSAAG